MIKVLAWLTNNAEQFCGQRKEGKFKCALLTKFCAGLHEKQDLSRTWELNNVTFAELPSELIQQTLVLTLSTCSLRVETGITTHIDCRPGISNSNCTEGQIRTYRATRRPHCGAYATMAWPELYTKQLFILFSTKSVVSNRHIIYIRLYACLKGTCSLAGRALSNTSE